MIGRELLRDALDRAVSIGRMTREDVEQLGSVFWQVASRQARDTLTGGRRRVDRVRGSQADEDSASD